MNTVQKIIKNYASAQNSVVRVYTFYYIKNTSNVSGGEITFLAGVN